MIKTSDRLTIYIDSCVWNIFFEHNLDLRCELPFDEFDLAMTKEVADFELSLIPENKRKLREYIDNQCAEASIRTDSFFGFSSIYSPSDYKSRMGGFNEGRFASTRELEVIREYEVSKVRIMKTGLYKDEADASLAVRAQANSIVLTAENSSKNGPLKKSSQDGGIIIYMKEFDPKKESLLNYVMENIPKNGF